MMLKKIFRGGDEPSGSRLEREGARQLASAVTKAGGMTRIPTDVLEHLHSSRSSLVKRQTSNELSRRAIESSQGKVGWAATDDIERSLQYIEDAKKAGYVPSFLELGALDELFARRTADLSLSDWKKRGTPVIGTLDTKLLNRVIGAHAKDVYLDPTGPRDELLFWLDFERSFKRGEIAVQAPVQTHDLRSKPSTGVAQGKEDNSIARLGQSVAS